MDQQRIDRILGGRHYRACRFIATEDCLWLGVKVGDMVAGHTIDRPDQRGNVRVRIYLPSPKTFVVHLGLIEYAD